MPSDQSRLEGNRFAALLAPQSEPNPRRAARLDTGRPKVSVVALTEGHNRPRMHIAKTAHPRVIGIQHRGAIGRERLDQLAFRQCNLVRRREELDMRLTHVRHNTNGRRGNSPQRREFTAMVHTHLKHANLGRIVHTQN